MWNKLFLKPLFWIPALTLIFGLGAWVIAKGETPPKPDPSGIENMSNPDSKDNEAAGRVVRASVSIDPMRQQFFGVKSDKVRRIPLTKTIRTVGKFAYDERKIAEVNLKFDGWVKELYADFVGKPVRKGDPLFRFYSPKLVTAQQEFLLTQRSPSPKEKNGSRSDGQDHSSSRNRLLLWDLTESQIEQIRQRKEPDIYQTMLSPADGFVIQKSVLEGSHFEAGETLYKIADLSNVWLMADVFEYEIPLIRTGQELTFRCSSHPDREFTGTVSFIYPYLNEMTRSVKIRADVSNPDLLFQPDVFADVSIRVDLGETTVVPASAVLDSGTRKIVFLKREKGMFEPKEVRLGPQIGEYYPVRDGLREGEEVVTSANFLIDSESQLMASMEGMMGLLGMGDWKMEHSNMEMGGEMQMEEGSGSMKDMDMGKEGGAQKDMGDMDMGKDSGSMKKEGKDSAKTPEKSPTEGSGSMKDMDMGKEGGAQKDMGDMDMGKDSGSMKKEGKDSGKSPEKSPTEGSETMKDMDMGKDSGSRKDMGDMDMGKGKDSGKASDHDSMEGSDMEKK